MTAPGMWDRLVGQEHIVAALRDAVERGSVGHAYLFAGPQGVGRTPAAFALAAAVNCEAGGCGACAVCAKVLRRAHPDVSVVAPEGPQILVSQVRRVRDEAFRSPVEGRMKVFLVEDAERMNAAAANALLKVLEEPPADVLFVLLSGDPEDLPPTILSRCRRLDFAPLSPAVVRTVLTEHHDIDADTAEWAARIGGNLSRALWLAHDERARERHAAHLEVPSRLARGGPVEAIRVAAEIKAEVDEAVGALKGRQKEEAATHAEAYGEGRGTAAVRRALEDRHKREARKLEQDLYDVALGDLASFYRDVLVAAAGGGRAPLVNAERADRIAAAAERTDCAWLLEALDRIESARRAIVRNASPVLAIEALFMALGTPRLVPARAVRS